MRRFPLDRLGAPSRRDFLVGASVGAVGVLAGCSGYADADDSGATDDGGPVDSGAATDGGTDGGADGGPGPDGDSGATGADSGAPSDPTVEEICEGADLGSPTECRETPDMGEGPFFRDDAPDRIDLNPLDEDGSDPLVVCGRVLDAGCEPVAGAVIEVWHVAPEGEYDMKSSDFRFRGTMVTDADGVYGFSTLMPVSYRDGDTDLHQHIHVRVNATGFAEKITQICFADDPLAGDHIPSDVKIDAPLDAAGVRRGSFDFILVRA
ncbi:MAG: twin-arginine translocation signal domain-containing protein [Alphaproteobacteria bacterium]|nr:twin-arginine translocation signal domain-containing protein [Alphaproteobacteria bacterium]